ncbi:hypothetical protein [Metabacillus halosaccharovorans]|uniref:hypothetical protein n=1 Tax=Metabacillus halosaccharovorans TaxID=930124 RepID=UPI000994974A|nr:hypothetical protein [Metabacillus halosaccharovorans]
MVKPSVQGAPFISYASEVIPKKKLVIFMIYEDLKIRPRVVKQYVGNKKNKNKKKKMKNNNQKLLTQI